MFEHIFKVRFNGTVGTVDELAVAKELLDTTTIYHIDHIEFGNYGNKVKLKEVADCWFPQKFFDDVSSYQCNCGKSFEHHTERLLHMNSCKDMVFLELLAAVRKLYHDVPWTMPEIVALIEKASRL